MSDAAVTALVSGAVTITTLVVGFLTLWVRLRYATDKVEAVEIKLQTNTALTKAGAQAAATAAAHVEKQLNGGLDAAVETGVAPIRARLDELGAYVHGRNHEILTVLQTQVNYLGAMLVKMGVDIGKDKPT